MNEFFSMGGYGTYVWSSFGTAAVVLIWIAITSWRSVVANQRLLADLEPRVPRRRDRSGQTDGRDDAP